MWDISLPVIGHRCFRDQKTMWVISIALGRPPELHGKAVLLQTPHALVTRQRNQIGSDQETFSMVDRTSKVLNRLGRDKSINSRIQLKILGPAIMVIMEDKSIGVIVAECHEGN